MHSSVVIGRSETLAALLRAELNNEKKLVTLENQDPELFQEYVHCLYFGPQALRQWAQASVVKTEGNPVGNTRDEKQAAADLVFEQLIGLYTLAANLVDFKTANMVVGEIVRASDLLGRIPAQRPLSLAYASTTRGSPLRSLLRDFWIYQAALTETDTERLRTADFPAECVQDIAIEMLRIGQRDSDDFDQAFKEVCVFNMCRYHQHDELHAACVAEEQGVYCNVRLRVEIRWTEPSLQTQTLTCECC
jgi:hypothetical protein